MHVLIDRWRRRHSASLERGSHTSADIKKLTRNGILTLLVLVGLCIMPEWTFLSTSTGMLVCGANVTGVILLVGGWWWRVRQQLPRTPSLKP